MTRYIERAAEQVDALQWTGTNIEEFQNWNVGKFTSDGGPGDSFLYGPDGRILAEGDWLVRHDNGRLEELNDELFNKTYVLVTAKTTGAVE